MSRIQTLRGDIAPAELGVTDCHDHLIKTSGLQAREDPRYLMPDVDKAVQEAEAFAAAGGCALVEMTPLGAGRDVPRMLQVAQRLAGRLHIVQCTGFHKGAAYDQRGHWAATATPEQIAALLAAEITQGLDRYSYNGPLVERVGARAGVIKAGTGQGTVTAFEQNTLRAAALAQQATGAAIMTHTERGDMAWQQVQWLQQGGADLGRVALCHVQRNPDPWYHRRLLDSGVTLCYDGPSRTRHGPDSTLVELIRAALRGGYGRQVVLAMDAGVATDQRVYGAATGIDYLLTTFVPRLRDEGIAASAIRDMLVHNPARLLAIRT